MKKPLFFVDKKLLKDLFENLIFDWAVSAIDVKKWLKVFAIAIGVFFIILINDGASLFFYFIDTRDLATILASLIKFLKENFQIRIEL